MAVVDYQAVQGEARQAYIPEVFMLLALQNDIYPRNHGPKRQQKVNRVIQWYIQKVMGSQSEHYILKYISKGWLMS